MAVSGIWAVLMLMAVAGLVESRPPLQAPPLQAPPLQAPPVPAGLSYKNSGLFYIWENLVKSQPTDRSGPSALSVLSPASIEVINLVPQDIGNPLYHGNYTDLTTDLINSHTLNEEVDPNDPRMSSPQGLRVQTNSGKNVVFKNDAGVLTVNGARVLEHQRLDPSGVILYELDRVLFDFYERVDKATEDLLANTETHYDPWGLPLISGPLPPTAKPFLRGSWVFGQRA